MLEARRLIRYILSGCCSGLSSLSFCCSFFFFKFLSSESAFFLPLLISEQRAHAYALTFCGESVIF